MEGHANAINSTTNHSVVLAKYWSFSGVIDPFKGSGSVPRTHFSCLGKKKIDSYEGIFKEVDVGVPPVIEGCVDGADHPREALGDGPGIAPTFRVQCEHPVVLGVVPPEPSSCVQNHLDISCSL